MDKRKVRFAPYVDGIPVAAPWSVLVQGDSYYVMTRRFGHLTKFSFHPHGVRCVNIDKHRVDLAVPKHIDHGWGLALQLAFLIGPEVREDIGDREKTVRLHMDRNQRMNVNVLVHAEQEGLIAPDGMHVFWSADLRSGGSICVAGSRGALSVADEQLIAETNAGLRASVRGPHAPNDVVVDAYHFSNKVWPDGTGALMAIVPAGPETIVWLDHPDA